MKELNELIEQWKTDLLADQCSSCEGSCCYFNLSELRKEQVRLIFGITDLEKNLPKNSKGEPIVEKDDFGFYKTHYPMSPNVGDGCPQLVDGNCAVYDHELKPAGCIDFPIGVNEVDRRMALHNYNCLAVSLEHPETVELCLSALDLGFVVTYLYGFTKELTRKYIICNEGRRTI